MGGNLLDEVSEVLIHLDSQKEIEKAPDCVFHKDNQEEARIMIFESDYVLDYSNEFSDLLALGKPLFASVTEPGRQTSFRYNPDCSQDIVLTKTHRGIEQILSALP